MSNDKWKFKKRSISFFIKSGELFYLCVFRYWQFQVAQAIDTLRAYIVSNNISLLPVLVELQKSLAIIAAQRNATEKMSSEI